MSTQTKNGLIVGAIIGAGFVAFHIAFPKRIPTPGYDPTTATLAQATSLFHAKQWPEAERLLLQIERQFADRGAGNSEDACNVVSLLAIVYDNQSKTCDIA